MLIAQACIISKRSHVYLSREKKSSIYTINNNGPKHEPCGIPKFTILGSDTTLFITVEWLLLLKKSFSKFNI